MRNLANFLKATALGGIVFLVPLVVFAVIIGKAFGIMRAVASPIAAFLPQESVAGIALADLLAMAVMLALTVVAGVIAESFIGKRIYGWIDDALTRLMPGYTYIKSLAGSLAEAEEQGLRPVLVRLDDLAQLGFEVERTPAGLVTVFLPGAPDARSGSVAYVTPDRVTPLDVRFHAAIRSMSQFGRGAAELLGAAGHLKAGA